MKDHYCSDIVTAVHDIFVLQPKKEAAVILEESYSDFPEATAQNIINFESTILEWRFFKAVESERQKVGIQSFTQELELKVYRLCSLRKNMDGLISNYTKTRDGLRLAIKNHHAKVKTLEPALKESGLSDKERQKRQAKVNEIKAQIKKDEASLVHEKLRVSKQCEDLLQKEEELKDYLLAEEKLRDKCIGMCEDYFVSEPMAYEIYGYSIDTRFLTYLSSETWSLMNEDASLGIQDRFTQNYNWDDVNQVHSLGRDLHYYSSIEEEQIIGDEPRRTGESKMDKMLKKHFLKSTLTEIFKEDRAGTVEFFTFIVREALSDGVMSSKEIKMVLELSKALNVTKVNSIEILDHEAVGAQQKAIQEKLKFLFDLAMADNELHRDEQNLILDTKRTLFRQIQPNLSQHLKEDDLISLNLRVDDEELFMALCRAAMSDKNFSNVERIFISEFTKKLGWSVDRVQKLIAKVNQTQ